MAVAGAPAPRTDHAVAAIDAARRMLRAGAAWRESHDVALQTPHRPGKWSGGGRGHGRQRVLFDLWGETVNTASRMESSGIAGRIQVAESTMQRASLECVFVERAVDLKGLGVVKAYLLES